MSHSTVPSPAMSPSKDLETVARVTLGPPVGSKTGLSSQLGGREVGAVDRGPRLMQPASVAQRPGVDGIEADLVDELGDDLLRVRIVTELIDQIGFDAVDAG